MHLCYRTEQGMDVPLATLCYRTEQGTNGHLLLSVHGFAITSYLLASMASKAAIGRRHVVQLGPRWPALVGAPERACGTDTTLGRSSGHGPEVRARRFMVQSSVWEIRIMS